MVFAARPGQAKFLRGWMNRLNDLRSEAGVPGFDVSAWYALFVPAKTPAAVIQKLHADTVAVLADPATKARLEQLGVGVIGSSPEELRTYLKAEMDKWGVIIKEAGIKVE